MNACGVASVRAATPADVPAVARVHVRAWHETYPGLLSDAVIASYTLAQREARWRAQLADPGASALFVAERDGAIVGFAGCGPNRGEPSGIPGELHAIYVLASEHGHGFGSALVAAVRAHLTVAGLVPFLAWVVDGNAALPFYEKRARRFVTQPADVRGDAIVEHGYLFA